MRTRVIMRQVIGSIVPEVRPMTATCLENTTLLCLECARFTAVVSDPVNSKRVAKKVRR